MVVEYKVYELNETKIRDDNFGPILLKPANDNKGFETQEEAEEWIKHNGYWDPDYVIHPVYHRTFNDE